MIPLNNRDESLAGQALRVQEELLAIAGRALTDREVVDRGLILAKERPTPTEVVRAMVYFGYSGIAHEERPPKDGADWETRFVRFVARTPHLKDQMNRYWNDLERDRQDFRERLNAVLANPKKAAKAMAGTLDRYRRDMLIVAKPVRFENEVQTVHRYYPQSIRSAYGYVLDLLLYADFARDLRRCNLPICRSFYLSAPTPQGGRRAVYCSTECQAVSKKLQDAERQTRYRERKQTSTRRGKKSPARKKR